MSNQDVVSKNTRRRASGLRSPAVLAVGLSLSASLFTCAVARAEFVVPRPSKLVMAGKPIPSRVALKNIPKHSSSFDHVVLEATTAAHDAYAPWNASGYQFLKLDAAIRMVHAHSEPGTVYVDPSLTVRGVKTGTGQPIHIGVSRWTDEWEWNPSEFGNAPELAVYPKKPQAQKSYQHDRATPNIMPIPAGLSVKTRPALEVAWKSMMKVAAPHTVRILPFEYAGQTVYKIAGQGPQYRATFIRASDGQSLALPYTAGP